MGAASLADLVRMADRLGVHAIAEAGSAARVAAVETFDDAEDFRAHGVRPLGCLVLDIRMPGSSGLELQARLAATRPDLPVVVITAHPTADVHARARAAGAVAVLEKPFEDELLLAAVTRALARPLPTS
jgi:two-component system response regulator FixJ